jgi:spore germination cell wall hydrolase CwlJ-like protein
MNYKEKEVFAKTLYFEAGSTCSYIETSMLAWVIRNRVKSKKYPNNYISVCMQRKQFSCWNGKTLNDVMNIELNNNRYMICMAIVAIVNHTPEKWNPLPGVMWYYNPQIVCPSWGLSYKRVYPNYELKHIFFKEK